MTVYFVDEDHKKFLPWLDECRWRGLDVVPIRNASEAFRVLSTAQDVQLAILDVMLSAKPDDLRFSHERTAGYLQTGLCLAEDLSGLGRGD